MKRAAHPGLTSGKNRTTGIPSFEAALHSGAALYPPVTKITSGGSSCNNPTAILVPRRKSQIPFASFKGDLLRIGEAGTDLNRMPSDLHISASGPFIEPKYMNCSSD